MQYSVMNQSNQPGKAGNLSEICTSELRQSELLLALQLLESCTDGSALVRRESIIAISKFVALSSHFSIIKSIAKFIIQNQADKNKKQQQQQRQQQNTKIEDPVSQPYELDSQDMTKLMDEVQKLIYSYSLPQPNSLPGKLIEDEEGTDAMKATAATYVRIWLALLEIELKEIHPIVSAAVCTVTCNVRKLVKKDISGNPCTHFFNNSSFLFSLITSYDYI
jgi:hypothetical protein